MLAGNDYLRHFNPVVVGGRLPSSPRKRATFFYTYNIGTTVESYELNNLAAKLLPEGVLARSLELRFAIGEFPTYKVIAQVADSDVPRYADFFGKIYLKPDAPVTHKTETNEQNR